MSCITLREAIKKLEDMKNYYDKMRDPDMVAQFVFLDFLRQLYKLEKQMSQFISDCEKDICEGMVFKVKHISRFKEEILGEGVEK